MIGRAVALILALVLMVSGLVCLAKATSSDGGHIPTEGRVGEGADSYNWQYVEGERYSRELVAIGIVQLLIAVVIGIAGVSSSAAPQRNSTPTATTNKPGTDYSARIHGTAPRSKKDLGLSSPQTPNPPPSDLGAGKPRRGTRDPALWPTQLIQQYQRRHRTTEASAKGTLDRSARARWGHGLSEATDDQLRKLKTAIDAGAFDSTGSTKRTPVGEMHMAEPSGEVTSSKARPHAPSAPKAHSNTSDSPNSKGTDPPVSKWLLDALVKLPGKRRPETAQRRAPHIHEMPFVGMRCVGHAREVADICRSMVLRPRDEQPRPLCAGALPRKIDFRVVVALETRITRNIDKVPASALKKFNDCVWDVEGMILDEVYEQYCAGGTSAAHDSVRSLIQDLLASRQITEGFARDVTIMALQKEAPELWKAERGVDLSHPLIEDMYREIQDDQSQAPSPPQDNATTGTPEHTKLPDTPCPPQGAERRNTVTEAQHDDTAGLWVLLIPALLVAVVVAGIVGSRDSGSFTSDSPSRTRNGRSPNKAQGPQSSSTAPSSIPSDRAGPNRQQSDATRRSGVQSARKEAAETINTKILFRDHEDGEQYLLLGIAASAGAEPGMDVRVANSGGAGVVGRVVHVYEASTVVRLTFGNPAKLGLSQGDTVQITLTRSQLDSSRE